MRKKNIKDGKASSSSSTPQKQKSASYEVDPAELLINFFRFSSVLSKLESLDLSLPAIKKWSRKLPELDKTFSNNWFASLFGDEKKEKLITKERAEFIKKIFLGGSSVLASVYDCRNFYGLDSPNNLQHRFKGVLEKIGKGEPLSVEHGRPSVSRYDHRINSWGEFAAQLVDANGGWKSFSSAKSLNNVVDVWIEEGVIRKWLQTDTKASEPDSFIQRILHLARDRYTQILTTPAGPLWGLWFLKSRDRLQALERVSGKQGKDFYLGRKLPDAKLYIDISDRIETMKGLPFPFGYAADTLSKLSQGGDGPWTSESINFVAKSLVNLRWCPPLLFGGRGDQWEQPDSEAENKVVPYIALGAHVKFGTVYLRKSKFDKTVADQNRKELNIKEMRIVYEPYTWGQVVVQQLTEKYRSVNAEKATRDEMLSRFDTIGADLVLSYYPANSLIDSNTEDYTILSYKEIYQIFGEDGDLLAYDLPNTVLASGTFLSRQPKTPSLIEDLAIYLHKVETVFRHLSPDWRSTAVVPGLKEIAGTSKEVKERGAVSLSRACDNSVRMSSMFKMEKIREAVPIRPNQIEQWAHDIGEEMAVSIVPDRNPDKLESLARVYESWGWAMLLPFIRDMSVYISCDLFSGLERRKTDEE